MSRLPQLALIVSTLLGSWLGMQAVHELGHVLGALVSGATIDRLALHPFSLSQTDVTHNRNPLLVVWAGPIFGVFFPLLLWCGAAAVRLRGAYVLRFFAGFCLVANGAYIGVGAFDGVGDCGEMLEHGTPIWLLWAFGAVTFPCGLLIWHRQGPDFGLGTAKGRTDGRVAVVSCAVFLGLLLLGFFVWPGR